MQAHVVGLEADLAPGGEARGYQILHDLVLSVHRDRAAAGELGEREAMAFAVELQVNAMVDESFAVHPLSDAHGTKEIHGAVLEHACALPSLDVRPVAVLDDDRVDAGTMEQVAEREPGRSGADDGDLGASPLCCHSKEASRAIPLAVRGVCPLMSAR